MIHLYKDLTYMDQLKFKKKNIQNLINIFLQDNSTLKFNDFTKDNKKNQKRTYIFHKLVP